MKKFKCKKIKNGTDKFKELFILLVIDVIHSQAKYNYQHLFSHFWKVTNTFWLLVCLFLCVY